MGFKVIKAIKINEEKDIDKYKEFRNADVILFDTPGMEKSLEFPKNLIDKLPLGEKYALAGSISEDNISNIYKLETPTLVQSRLDVFNNGTTS